MRYKKYEKLDLTDVYKDKGYNKKYYPLLNEYFSRLKHEFNLTEDELIIKLGNLINIVDKISYTNKLPKNFKHTNGQFSTNKYNICINKNKDLINYYNFFHFLSHEVTHATSLDLHTREYGMYRKTKKDNIIEFNKSDKCLDEVVTEMFACFIANNKDKENILFSSKGYEDIMYIGSILSSTLGISEKEMLTYAIKGRKYFDEQLSKKFTSNEYYNLFCDNLSKESSDIYNINYENFKNQLSKEDKINLHSASNKLVALSLHAMDNRIKNDLTKIENITEYTQKQRFFLNKILLNYRESFENYNIENKDDDILLNSSSYIKLVQDRIIYLEVLDKNKDTLTKEEYNKYINLCNNTDNCNTILDKTFDQYIDDIKSCKEDFNKPLNPQYISKFMNEFFDEEEWEDPTLHQVVRKSFGNKLFDKIAQTFSNIKEVFRETKNNYLSPPPSDDNLKNNENKENLFDTLAKLKQERIYEKSQKTKDEKNDDNIR